MAFLADYLKDIVDRRPKIQHQVIDGKLSCGKPVQIQIPLHSAVKQLAQTPVFPRTDIVTPTTQTKIPQLALQVLGPQDTQKHRPLSGTPLAHLPCVEDFAGPNVRVVLLGTLEYVPAGVLGKTQSHPAAGAARYTRLLWINILFRIRADLRIPGRCAFLTHTLLRHCSSNLWTMLDAAIPLP